MGLYVRVGNGGSGDVFQWQHIFGTEVHAAFPCNHTETKDFMLVGIKITKQFKF